MPEDRLWLFGSRTDLARRGGDIDLYVETHVATADDAVVRKTKFLSALMAKIGEQKIDLVVNLMYDSYALPIYEIAKTKGVRLI